MGRLYWIQVSESVGKKSCTNGAIAAFLARLGYSIGIPEQSSIEIIYCRKSEQSEWILTERDYDQVYFALPPVT
jgi:hypothetical protein